MPNLKSIINQHNKIVLDLLIDNSKRTCNCREKCPLQEKRLTNNIMYKATLTSNQDNYQHKIYYGITKTKFNLQYENHISYGKYLENTRCITLTLKGIPYV